MPATNASPNNASPKSKTPTRKSIHKKWENVSKAKLLEWATEHEIADTSWDDKTPKKAILDTWVAHLWANKMDYKKEKGPLLGEKVEFGDDKQE